MSVLPDVIPFLHCPKLNLKFMSPTFCQKRKALKSTWTTTGIIFSDPTVVICKDCKEPITIIK